LQLVSSEANFAVLMLLICGLALMFQCSWMWSEHYCVAVWCSVWPVARSPWAEVFTRPSAV